MKVSKTGEVGAVAPTEKVAEGRPATPIEKKDKVSKEKTEEVNRAIAVARQSASGARAANLDQIEAQIRAGTFKPSPSAIAERLLQAAEIQATIQAALRH